MFSLPLYFQRLLPSSKHIKDSDSVQWYRHRPETKWFKALCCFPWAGMWSPCSFPCYKPWSLVLRWQQHNMAEPPLIWFLRDSGKQSLPADQHTGQEQKSDFFRNSKGWCLCFCFLPHYLSGLTCLEHITWQPHFASFLCFHMLLNGRHLYHRWF